MLGQRVFYCPSFCTKSTCSSVSLSENELNAIWKLKAGFWPENSDFIWGYGVLSSWDCVSFITTEQCTFVSEKTLFIWALNSCFFLFSAEKVTSMGKDWHKFCLKCEKCKKTLISGGHSEVRVKWNWNVQILPQNTYKKYWYNKWRSESVETYHLGVGTF